MKSKAFIKLNTFYLLLVFLGTIMIILSFKLNKIDSSVLALLSSFGSSFIATGVISLSITCINNQSEKARLEKLKENYLCKMIIGLKFIVTYTSKQLSKDSTLDQKDELMMFGENIQFLENFDFDNANKPNSLEIKHALLSSLMNLLKPGLEYCSESCSLILPNKDLLIISNIFSEQEILFVSNIQSHIESFKHALTPSEIGEKLKYLSNQIFKLIPDAKNHLKDILCV